MEYGICNLSIVPIRADKSDASEQVSQLLYGDVFKILEQRKSWVKIRVAYDHYEGWIDKKQYSLITEEQYNSLNTTSIFLSGDLIEFIEDENSQLYPILLGSSLNGLSILNHSFDGSIIKEKKAKENIIDTCFIYLNTPYL